MLNNIHDLTIAIILAPLLGAITAGFFGKKIGRNASHWVTTLLVGVSLLLSAYLAKLVFVEGQTYNGAVYTWILSGSFNIEVGFLIDRLSTLMFVTVNFVSFLVHIYSIGYMHDDAGYQRFFSYISLFTFAMLMLVSANNLFQLYFGWEGVGVVSYLLIGFWYKRESANVGSLKAFLVNRVGDFGFLLGIAAVLDNFGTINYAQIFAQAPELAQATLSIIPGSQWSLISVICLLLFVGAMGKSAQMPLHIWLPESMEGPTPISALIHAATMVTAGIFMVSRMSPLFELSEVALTVILVIGAAGALFLGLVAVVQHDIKRVVAYSTLSQLGYMTAALGASAFSAGMFHLVTHACFKALLFLGAGSVIIAMHHDQDLRNMGNLKKYMPITYITFLIGALSLSAIPPMAGFYSKDAIIEAVKEAAIPGAGFAYVCVLLGAFVTALYTFRAFFLAFHGKEKMDQKAKAHLRESPAVVWVPLVLLAIPSIIAGGLLIGPMLFGKPFSLLGETIYVAPQYNVLTILAEHYHGAWQQAQASIHTLPFWLAIAGIFTAWFSCILVPNCRQGFVKRFPFIYKPLIHKYGFDEFYQYFFIRGSRCLAQTIYQIGDVKFIDHIMVNGSARLVAWLSSVFRRLQSGYLYHYAFAMILGLVVFLVWLVLP